MKRIHTHRTSEFNTIQFSKELRKNQTKAELILWKHLKKKQLCGFKFRHQHPIGSYIADFYCNEAALLIKLQSIKMLPGRNHEQKTK
ncbi:MAG: DUF559 domain-containing protein [Deltaproteobacteria bacterium]|nr:DUF559 domain-containing protein [Deltaproteobacteria bacterium]